VNTGDIGEMTMGENMEKGQKEARIGLDSEKDIVNIINTNEQFRNSVKRCLENLGFCLGKEIKARTDNMKTDIFIEDDLQIGVSIKSSTKTSFHHLDRRWLEEWKKVLTMPDDIFITLKEAIMRIAKNSKDYFILPQDREKIRDFFAKHIENVINDIFTHGEKALKVFMVNDKRKHKLYFFRMEDVINFLVKNILNNITFSRKGIIKLGDYITVQRKSGDSSKITIPKTDWNHPGNQLQFKFSPLKFAEFIEKTNSIALQIIQINYPASGRGCKEEKGD
jgi:hypothetical protein